jgi:hypothetical protein
MCAEFIAEFNNAVQALPEGSVLISSPPRCEHAISTPPQSEYLFLVGNRKPSPIALSSKDSANNESTDDFASIDAPRGNLPRAYHSTPKHMQKSKVLPLIKALIKSSEPAQVPSSSMTPRASLATLEPHIKQEVTGIYGPTTIIPPRKYVYYAPFAHSSQNPQDQPKPLPTIPLTQPSTPTMNNPPYRMPVHRTDKASKFNGTTADLIEFLDIYDMHTDKAGLQAGDHIKQLLCYLKVDK